MLFEPVVSLSTGFLVNAEAIGVSALRTACRRSAEWNDTDSGQPIVVSADASAEQFHDNFADTVRAAVDDAGADPVNVGVELTEQLLMVDVDATTRILGELRGIGVSVTIDHFGSGYSSLDSLTRMAVGAIKIPPSFISGSVANDTAMIASVIGLAHAMELDVIVEGVKSADQMVRLRELGGDAAQGSWVGAPVTAAEMQHNVSAARSGHTLVAVAAETPTARTDPALIELLHAARDRHLRGPHMELQSLSARQLDILGRLLDGDRPPAIARDLYVSASTVRNHLGNIFTKLGVHSQEELLTLLRSIQLASDDA